MTVLPSSHDEGAEGSSAPDDAPGHRARGGAARPPDAPRATGAPRAPDAPHLPPAWADLFALLIEQADLVYLVLDRHGSVLWANRAAGALAGRPAQQLVGQPWRALIAPRERDGAMARLARWQREGEHGVLEFEAPVRPAEGGELREIVWSFHRDHRHAQRDAFAVIGRDLTELRNGQRALAAESRLNRALLHGMLDPVVAIDDQGTIQMASHSVFRIFGWESDELVGRNVSMLMPEPHRSRHDDYLSNYRDTGETNILDRLREFEIVRKDGTVTEIELSVARVDPPDGTTPLFIGSFRDLGPRKRAQRAETAMLRALASLGRSAAVLAHEIKNPITSVNLALRAVADQLGADQREVLGELVSRMQLLETRLRQTLAYAKPLELRRTRCDARQLAEDVGRALGPMLDRDQVRLGIHVAPDTPAIDGDPLRLEEVLTNLVRNAAEALPEGGRVRVSAAPAEGGVQLEVEDDGPGVAASLTSTLFEPFVSSKDDGTGLGLAICRRMIEAHGGSLDLLEPGELGGARFRLLLPRADAAPRGSAP